MIIALSVVVNNFKRAPNLVKTQMGGQVPPLPPLRLRHCCRVILYHTAKAAFIYVLHTELYAYVDAHRHRCVLVQPKGQLSIANYL